MFFQEKKQTRPRSCSDLQVEAFMLLQYRFGAHLHSMGFWVYTLPVTCSSSYNIMCHMFYCHHKFLFRGACFRTIICPSFLRYPGQLLQQHPCQELVSVGDRAFIGSGCLFSNLIFARHPTSHSRPWSALICFPENVLQQIFFSKFL